MRIDIYNTEKKYDILYTDPPWDSGAGRQESSKAKFLGNERTV